MRNKEDGVEVNFQNKKPFWESKTIRPDLVITKTVDGSIETFIIDTKWKVIDAKQPDENDLKQIFAYNLYWNSYHSVLLYPSTARSTASVRGKYYEGLNKDHGCTLGFVDVLDGEGRLNRECSKEIFNLLLTE